MDEPKRVRWRKIGGGSLRMAGRIIKPGQIFEAAEKDIPPAFRDVIVPVDNNYVSEIDHPLEVKPPGYEIKMRSPGWFDVVDSRGKRVNEKALHKAEAESLLQSLE